MVSQQRIGVFRCGIPCARVIPKQSCHLCRQGVTHTLDQVFSAPLLIKKVMNDESGITRAFVGAGCGPASAFSISSCMLNPAYIQSRPHHEVGYQGCDTYLQSLGVHCELSAVISPLKSNADLSHCTQGKLPSIVMHAGNA